MDLGTISEVLKISNNFKSDCEAFKHFLKKQGAKTWARII